MKKFFTCLVSMVALTTTMAQTISVYDQLLAVNKQWQYMKDADPRLKSRVPEVLTEVKLVQLHLKETEKLLRSRDVSHLSNVQRSNRAELLDILHSYWVRGVFPKNTFHKERRPYFIDIFNNYCAVGHLMKMSGADAMARDIKRTQNFSYLKDIHHPSLDSWIMSSGFTADELALIQPSYDCYPTSLAEIHYNNSGNDVNEYIEYIQASQLSPNWYGVISKLEFYDNNNNLYKTVLYSSMGHFVAGPGNGPMSQVSFHYYAFPANESFADIGKVRAVNTTGGIDRTVLVINYDASVIDVDYYNVQEFTPNFGQITQTKHYAIGQDGTGSPGISINFCASGCTNAGNIPMVPGFLTETVGSANLSCLPVLPLNLLNFGYSVIPDKIILNWRTSSESNTDHYEIEKSSNGTDFSKIGNVQAAVNNTVSRDYNFADGSPNPVNYYRLKQVNRDGTYNYSKIILAKFKVNSPLVLYTPVVIDNLRLGINLPSAGIHRLNVIDISGRTGVSFKASSGLNEINISKLAQGSYILRLETNNGESFSEKFVKQ